MDKYEISLWEDYNDGSPYLKERKIAVIGSDTMRAHGVQARAIEPNLVTDTNGTNTFTFKMYYTYTDTMTGETYKNPFGKYLVNERKVKVFWKGKWYDLVIKKGQEDSSKKLVTYTCTDVYINELSKNGYSLEFDTELENNIGTAEQLAVKVLDGSTWQYDFERSQPIIQRTEGPVYDVTITYPLTVKKQSPGTAESLTIPAGKRVLIFYDSLVSILDQGGTVDTQLLYAPEGYIRDINNSLVINGDCCVATLEWVKDGNTLKCPVPGLIAGTCYCTINLQEGVSTEYRAERLVDSYITKYESVLKRYVTLCDSTRPEDEGKTFCEVSTTEYSNPLTVVNLCANPKEFSNVSGWLGAVDNWFLYPGFDQNTQISEYVAKAYLKVSAGTIYNTGIQSNLSYFTPTDIEISKGAIGGIQKGETYIFRIRFFNWREDTPVSTQVFDRKIVPNIYKITIEDDNYIPNGNSIFNISSTTSTSDGWYEYTMVCNTSISANEINDYGLFLTSTGNYSIEEVQFFKEVMGVTSYAEGAHVQRINPGEVSLQSYAQSVYKYYEDSTDITSAEDLTYVYVGEARPNYFIPRLNNYEKIGTISVKESNRFDILQTIAETFKAWVKFEIIHDETGAVKFIDGRPQKFVYFVPEIGQETGISFEYGIDLKTISRTIDSDNLATKILVRPNANEFATNGFCTIARSPQNYTRENFILNLDYFTQQNLLDKDALYSDLYGVNGYYSILYNKNTEYDKITDILLTERADKQRYEAELKVYEQYLLAANQQLEQIESDLMSWANASTWDEVQNYAKDHYSNTQVQSLLNSYGQTQNEISNYQNSVDNLKQQINKLDADITTKTNTQKELVDAINDAHTTFNNKYGTYLLEGTWQDENYIDDTKYYLDGLNVAYTSSRPQLSYNINILRLSGLEAYSSKVFQLGDICHIQDREFFGYLSDGITPYKEKILVNKISSFFDQPEKDVITVQNYKTQFDDLFQRIAAATQSLQYSEGTYARVVDMVNSDNTLDFSVLQDTITQNENLVINSSNQNVTWDDTGITVTNKNNTADKTKIMAGGIFLTNDGGVTWKNAIRGDGISADVITAGHINTGEIFIYDGDSPSFRWDGLGLTAYDTSSTNINFVRHDKFGMYGYSNSSIDFVANSIQDIKNNASFGITWDGFFLKDNNEVVFSVDSNGAQIAGWNIDRGSLYTAAGDEILGLYSIPSSTQIGNEMVDCYMVAGSNFFLATDGTLYANNVHMTGEIIQDESYAGNIVLNNEGIVQTTGDKSVGFYSGGKSMVILDKDLDCYLAAGDNFGVTLDGGLYCSLGQVAGWFITENDLYGGNATITPPSTVTYPYNNPELYGNYLGMNKNGTIYGYYRTPGGVVGSTVTERYTRWYIGPDPDQLTTLPIEIGSVPSDWGWPSDMDTWEWTTSNDFQIVSQYYEIQVETV